MNDQNKTKDQLIAELADLRQRIADQDAKLAHAIQAEDDRRRIADGLPVLVATARLDGYYQEVNAAFERILGWTESESLSRPFAEFIHPDDREAAMESFARLKSGEPAIDFQDRHVCKDGSYRWINWTVIPLPDRGIVYGIGQDFTERKQAEDDRERAEEAVRQSEQRMRLHVEQTPLSVIEWDRELRVVKWNPGAERVFGYTEAEARGRDFTFLVPPHAQEDVKHVRDALLLKKGGERSTNENITKDGRAILCEWYNTPLANAEGEVVGFASLTEDITEQKRAEDDLKQAKERLEQRVRERTAELTEANERLRAEVQQRRKSEQELTIFRRFAEASGLGFGMADLDGNITYVNPTLFRWSNEKTPEDCIGKPLSAYMPADYRGRRESEILPAIRQKGFWQGEEPVHLRDGRTVYTIFSVFPVTDENGKLLRTAVVITDITELKGAEQALRKSEAKYRALVESCPDPVVMVDLQGRTVFASHRAVEQHRVVDADALIGRSAADFVAESDRENYKESIGRLIEDGVHRNVEYTFLREDGSKFEAEVSSSVIWDATGKPEALMAVYRDVSERKRAEEAIRKEQESLRRLLKASDRERELITYDIHDGVAQQLLGALMNLEAVSKRGLDFAEAEEKCRFDAGLAALRRASAEARSLMNRMRTPVLERFGIQPAIADFIDQLMDRPDAPEIVYRCEADFGRLEPVLENTIFRVAQEAITNACVHSHCDLLRVSLTQHNEQVTVEVQDNGVGFELADRKEDRFGLHGIRERVRLLGRNLTIETAPGQGTRMQATFPLIFRNVQESARLTAK